MAKMPGIVEIGVELDEESLERLKDQFLEHSLRKAPVVIHPAIRWYDTTAEWQMNKLGKSLQRQIKWILVDMNRLKEATDGYADAVSDCEASLKNLLRVYRKEHPDGEA